MSSDGVEEIDITDRVTCYEHGKTFKCNCGQGFGVKFEKRAVKCPTCSAILVDNEWASREPVEHDRSGQVTLGQFT